MNRHHALANLLVVAALAAVATPSTSGCNQPLTPAEVAVGDGAFDLACTAAELAPVVGAFATVACPTAEKDVASALAADEAGTPLPAGTEVVTVHADAGAPRRAVYKRTASGKRVCIGYGPPCASRAPADAGAAPTPAPVAPVDAGPAAKLTDAGADAAR